MDQSVENAGMAFVMGANERNEFFEMLRETAIQYLTTALGRILFSSVVLVLAFRPGVPGSNPVQILYFCHAFIHLFLCYGFCA